MTALLAKQKLNVAALLAANQDRAGDRSGFRQSQIVP